MNDREKRLIERQLKQQASQITSLDDEQLLDSILLSCSALLKIALQTLREGKDRNFSEIVYANYMNISRQVIESVDIVSPQNTDSQISANLKEKIEKININRRELDSVTAEYNSKEKECNELKQETDRIKSELEKLKGIEESLKDMLKDYSPYILSEKKEENSKLLQKLSEQQKKSEKLEEERREISEKIEAEILKIKELQTAIDNQPQNIKALHEQFSELKTQLEELKSAEINCSEEKQQQLKQEIAELTPIVEHNSNAVDILSNRLESLKKQNIIYDSEKKRLSADSIKFISSFIEELKNIADDYQNEIEQVQNVADTLTENISECDKKRSEYKNWFDADETPLSAMIKNISYPENETLRNTLNPAQIESVRQLFADIRNSLLRLDSIIDVCTQASKEDLQRIKKRANQ